MKTPIKYYIFVSYTRRDSHVNEIARAIEQLFHTLKYERPSSHWMDSINDFLEIDCLSSEDFGYAFLDILSLGGNPNGNELSLAERLLNAIKDSACMLSIVTDSYFSSPWCSFELMNMLGDSIERSKYSSSYKGRIYAIRYMQEANIERFYTEQLYNYDMNQAIMDGKPIYRIAVEVVLETLELLSHNVPDQHRMFIDGLIEAVRRRHGDRP